MSCCAFSVENDLLKMNEDFKQDVKIAGPVAQPKKLISDLDMLL